MSEWTLESSECQPKFLVGYYLRCLGEGPWEWTEKHLKTCESCRGKLIALAVGVEVAIQMEKMKGEIEGEADL